MNNFIGITAHYRPMYESAMKKSKVVRVEEMQSFVGENKTTLLHLEDGSAVDASVATYSLSETA